MRFCMVTTFYPPYNFGGDGIFVHRLANALASRGHHVEVVHCVDAYFASGGRPRKDTQQGNHPNVTVHALKSPLGLLSPLATQQTGRPLFKSAQLRRIFQPGFDVIHYHNISLVGGPKILEYGTGIKLYTMHEYWLICPTHVLFKFNRDVCRTPSCLLCEARYLRPPQWWRHSGLLRESIRHVDAFIAPDRFSIQKHRDMGFNAPMVHLPHFIALNDLPLPDGPSFSDPVRDSSYFLFVGRLEKLKGLQTVIPIFRRYRKAKLLIAGTGTYEPELRRLAAGDGNIRFLGYVSGADLTDLYRGAVAVIVPSINYEVSPPLVAIEALSVGTPAIVRNLGSMPELVADSGGGCLFDSEEELTAAMDRLTDDAAYRNQLGARGHDCIISKRSEQKYFEEYFDLIERIRSQKRAATKEPAAVHEGAAS